MTKRYYYKFTTFTKAINAVINDGLSRLRLATYIAYLPNS